MSNCNGDERLETPKQLAERVGVKERIICHLVNTCQIEHVWMVVGYIPMGAFARFVEARKVKPCKAKRGTTSSLDRQTQLLLHHLD